MKARTAFFLLCTMVLLSAATSRLVAQVNVTTWHNNLARTGANTHETILTPANVADPSSFGQLFSVPLDGAVYAQPLYLSGLTINGGLHNVVFAATEHDSVYAIDADTGTILWQRSFLGPGMTSVPSSLIDCQDISPELGITGTPVIDPASQIMYLVTTTEPGPIQQLHAISVLTGQDTSVGPTTISASVPGTGAGASNGVVAFDPVSENQRAALTLTNGHLIIGWGSHCDNGAFHGWLMAYSAASLTQEAVLMTTPDGSDGGIWMAGGGASVDSGGNIYFGSSNGDFNYPSATNLGDTIFRMPAPVAGQAWMPVDGFAPWNQASFDTNDEDVGASADLLLPDLPAGAAHPQLLITHSKNGEIFLIDRNHMGLYCAACSSGQLDTNIVQELPFALTDDTTGSPVYWNGTVYFGDSRAGLKAFSFNTSTGALSSQATQTGAYVFPRSAPTPSISSNGNTNGILWALDGANVNGEVLLAYDATNLGNLLAEEPVGYPGTHFAVPTVVNGKVYAGANGALVAFGILNQKPVLTITAANVTVPYNQAIPALTGYTPTGFVNGDSSSVLSGAPSETTTAVQGSPAGQYPITITQGTLEAANYAFAFVNGTLTISGNQPQTITFPPIANSTYGAGPVPLTASASSGLPVTYAVSGPALLSGSSLQLTGAGTVAVTATQTGNANFAPATPVTETFAVNKALLDITAASRSVPFGQPLPALTGYSATGFVGHDTSAVLSGAPAETTTATQGSPAGNYPISITQGTLAAANYSFQFLPGTLTITSTAVRVALSFTPNPVPQGSGVTYTVTVQAAPGLANPVGTITLYGLLPDGQAMRADGPRPIGTAGNAGSSTVAVILSGSVASGTYTFYAVFQPASGSPYPATNSPTGVLTFQ